MKTIINNVAKFLKDEEGLTTVEYAVAGTLIALAVVVAFATLGNQVNKSISSITSAITP
jgi:pilus assembly protein Flp/PilA